MPVRFIVAIAGVLAALGIAAAIGSAQSPAPTVNMSISPRSVTVPSTPIAGGPTRLAVRNSGKRPGELAVVSLRAGVTVQQLRARLRRRAAGPQDFKRLVVFEAGSFIAPGATYTTTIDLKPDATYVVLNIARNVGNSPLAPFSVGAAGTGTRPVPAKVVGMYDYAYAMDPSLPRRGVVRFENRGDRIHFAVAFPLRRGASRAAAVRALIRNQERRFTRLAIEQDAYEPVGVVSGGSVNDVEVNFRRPGNWVFACFLSDGERGAEHNTLGMVKAFRVR